MSGIKMDDKKPRFSLVPDGFIMGLISGLEYGASKYPEADNWKRVPDARRRYYDALMRHIDAWWTGEDLDPESGLTHLTHAACCLAFLFWFDTQVVGTDIDLKRYVGVDIKTKAFEIPSPEGAV